MTGEESTPGPRLFALLGKPVAHSCSPALHGAAFEALGTDAAYGALEVEGREVEPVMRSLARAGGGGNVTLPHKQRAAEALDRPSAAVRATGSCNCFWGLPGGGLAGDNTDVEGFLEALAELLHGAGSRERAGLVGRRVLLLGAGGAARAVLHGCRQAGAERVDVLNRTQERAEAMAETVGSGEVEGAGRTAVRVLEDRTDLAGRYDVVVNATSLGMEGEDPLPLDLSELEVRAAFDLVYGEEETAWVRHARRLGIPARDGLDMLVRQAAASVERWMDRPAPLTALREAARRTRR